jgi:arylsulfatase A-like enzyme
LYITEHILSMNKFKNCILCCITIVLTFTFSISAAEESTRMPNLIILLADDLGYGELGCQGNKEIPTPHIDGIAKRGVRFTQGYVTAPNCSPSRAGLLTGKYGTRFGHEFNPTGAKNEEPGFGLPLSQKTLADSLQKTGYVNGLIGKWHLGGTAPYHPFRRGFDEFFGFTHEGHYFVPEPWKGTTTWLRRSVLPGGGKGRRAFEKVIYSTHMVGGNEPDYDANNPIVRGSQPIQEEEYFTDAITRESIDFIDRHADKPFFLFVSYNAVHSPLQAADKYMNKFKHIEDIQRRIFAAMLANLDDSVGGIMKKLTDKGLEKDTLVFFLSDNGGPTKELTSSNLPLRGGKGQMYEGGIRVPFLFQWPGKVPAGKTYDRPVISTDIFATIHAAAGAPKPKVKYIESNDLLPYLTGKHKEDPHEWLYWRQSHKTAFRIGDMKIVRQSPQKWEMYDLAKDPSETNNLNKKQPEEFKSLLEGWEKINGNMVEPLFK